MNDTETFQQRMARLIAEADAFVEAGRRTQEASSRAYRSMGIDLRNSPPLGSEDLSLDQRLECEAFVEAHICRCQPPLGVGRFDGLAELAVDTQSKKPPLLVAAGTHARRSASRVFRFI